MDSRQTLNLLIELMSDSFVVPAVHSVLFRYINQLLYADSNCRPAYRHDLIWQRVYTGLRLATSHPAGSRIL